MRKFDLLIVGSGIVGLAHAALASKAGLKVGVIDSEERPVGASVRNFGMIWPIGRRPGEDLLRAIRSRQHWLEWMQACGVQARPMGSMHLACHPLERQVMEEFLPIAAEHGLECSLLGAEELRAGEWKNILRHDRIEAGLVSQTEVIVNPVEAVRSLARHLEEQCGVEFFRSCTVLNVEPSQVHSNRGSFEAARILLATGQHYDWFFPQVWQNQDIVRCRLQMMRIAIPDNMVLPRALASGMSMVHYPSFSGCPSLPELEQHYRQVFPSLELEGVHILISQHVAGQLVIGDSHEYAYSFEPFQRWSVNETILNTVEGYLQLPQRQVLESWDGVYLKHRGQSYFSAEPVEGIKIVNGFGGQGMTLSFGAAEDELRSWGIEV